MEQAIYNRVDIGFYGAFYDGKTLLQCPHANISVVKHAVAGG